VSHPLPFESFPPLQFSSEPKASSYDAIVVGSGPNGLAAAITIAEQGRRVLVLEANDTIGGGLRSRECTLPGFTHDVCSAIHALGVTSPFFKQRSLEEFGLQWITPTIAAAQAMDDECAAAYQSLEKTVAELGDDGDAYRRLMQPFVDSADHLLAQNLGPFRLPKHPILMTRFGLRAMRSAVGLAKSRFQSDRAQGLFAGMAAHSILPLENSFTAAVGLMLLVTLHAGGWPIARGGSQQIANALARYLESLGGEIVINQRVKSLAELPKHRTVLFDLAPKQIAEIAADELPSRYIRTLKNFRHGPGAYKLDWALSSPIPWKSELCAQAGTVHVGGNLAEVAAAERAPWEDRCAKRPFILVAQQSLFDDTRAPQGQHTGWGYAHVPPGSTEDITEQIETQIERFAPGFRDSILARHVTRPSDFEADNANYVGGDITGGVMDLRQLFTRPAARWNPYTTPNQKLYICSASTPPGAGVHGMCGYHAAKTALSKVLR